MKNAITILVIVMISTQASAYTLSTSKAGAQRKWVDEQIDIHIDPSVLEISEYADAVIMDAFLRWTDHMDQEITLNFITAECTPWVENCVRHITKSEYCSGVACAFGSWSNSTGQVINYNIDLVVFNPSDLENVILHEAGHFFGMGHSENHKSIMYESITGADELHADDIAGIKTVYSTDGTVYPTPEIEPVEYHFQGCSVAARTNSTASLWGLLF